MQKRLLFLAENTEGKDLSPYWSKVNTVQQCFDSHFKVFIRQN